MIKKLFAGILSAAMIFSMTGCSELFEDDIPEISVSSSESSSKSDIKKTTEELPDVKYDPADYSLLMTVKDDSGELSLKRVEKAHTKINPGVWTIFEYFCAADLESDDGSCTRDLAEMIDATKKTDNLRFIVMCGGTTAWNNEAIDPKKLQTYIIANGDMYIINDEEQKNMSDPSTLSDFLITQMKKYASEKMGLILWNHGAGSIDGICFDDNYEGDSLSLKEIDQALLEVYNKYHLTFDFIGFDACLMGTLESANILASYADYFIGSQEVEPGCGWNYNVFGDKISENPSIDMRELGKAILDGFYSQCEEIEDCKESTLALYDLSKLDNLMIAYNSFFKDLYYKGKKDSTLVTGAVRAANSAKTYGPDITYNMVDLGDMISRMSEYASGSDKVLAALSDVIVYSVNGETHKNASGISTYYPLIISDSKEYKIFSGLCGSPYYLSIIDMLQQASINKLYFSDYDNAALFDNGVWTNEKDNSAYFDYIEPNVSGELDKTALSFEQEPAIDDEGTYFFILDEAGYNNMAYVYARVSMIMEDDEMAIIGDTYDVYQNEDYEYLYEDWFDGEWISLQDGQILSLYKVSNDDNIYVYSSPILMNDELYYLRITHNRDEGTITLDGYSSASTAAGAASRDFKTFENGDVFTPIYFEKDSNDYYFGEEYKYSSTDELDYRLMPEGGYYYNFIIVDIYGNAYEAPYAIFYVDEEGNLTYEAE